MKHIIRDIAKLTSNQWLTLISLLVLLNLVVMGGLLWIIASDVAPEQVPFKQVIFAQALPTRTPYPTFTPVAYAFSLSGELAAAPTPTNTRVPTWTPTITPTPLPTNTPTATPIPTNTPVPVVQQNAVRNTPTPVPTPTPDVDFTGSVRQLTPCENQGKHHIFIYVIDTAGNGIPGVEVEVIWPGGESKVVTGTKAEHPGLTDFAMFKGNYYLEVLGASSDVIGPITPDIPQDQRCEENGNPVANSFYHYSYEVTFTKVR